MLLLCSVPNADLPRGICEGQWRGEGGGRVEREWKGVQEERRQSKGGMEGGLRSGGESGEGGRESGEGGGEGGGGEEGIGEWRGDGEE